ncbi:divalent-cation tolerance protein CutA [Kitasatospora sp. NPDC048540]|uniref:divalent-cation tolerance protein CutA n=1 Tax=unclassified Kitasatospora TaxID=2633591 RepID=UPI00053A87FA|nr:divalent-cation tolerance protein CutA [Kitasatospora sp. MBT63]
MTDVLTVTTTTDSAEFAAALARSAVTAKLAACAQVDGPITSVYRWQGELETAREWRVVLKTTVARYPELEAHLVDGHPYDTPEVLATPVTAGSPGYLAWVVEQTARG